MSSEELTGQLTNTIPKDYLLNGILLDRNELIILTDLSGEAHILSSHPLDDEIDYTIYCIDLRDEL
jgi:hypothetical protein